MYSQINTYQVSNLRERNLMSLDFCILNKMKDSMKINEGEELKVNKNNTIV